MFEDVWGSVVVLSQQVIEEAKLAFPDVEIQFMDWEAHANFAELPNTDLIGPTGLTLTEHSSELIEASFAIGVSTYSSDKNLFRLRRFINLAFEKLRPERQMKIYNAGSALVQKGVAVFTDGTLIAPMTRAETRPWQYVQTSALLVPS